jgi:predicted dehydrogenase
MKWNTILIGLGRIGWQLELDQKRYHPCTHAGTIKALEDQFDLIGVCDRNKDKVVSFLSWWKSNKDIVYSYNHQELLKNLNKKIDFAVVCTGPDSHWQILKDLVDYSIPVILMEKPIAYNSQQIKDIESILQNVSIYVNFERRFHPNYQSIKQILMRKTLGDLTNIQGKVLAPSIKRDPLLEDAIHWLDLILWYVGKPKILYSYWEYNQNGIEERSIHLLKKDDVLIQLESGGKRQYFEFSMVLDFTRGRIEVGNTGIYVYRKAKSSRYEKFYELKKIPFQIKFKNPWIEMYQSIYQNLPNNFQDAILGISLYEELKNFDRNRTS